MAIPINLTVITRKIFRHSNVTKHLCLRLPRDLEEKRFIRRYTTDSDFPSIFKRRNPSEIDHDQSIFGIAVYKYREENLTANEFKVKVLCLWIERTGTGFATLSETGSYDRTFAFIGVIRGLGDTDTVI